MRLEQSREAASPRLMNRRRLLRVGGLGALGLNLAGLLRAQGQPTKVSRIRSCILIFYYGGPSHHDTWDMKPQRPARGPGRVLVDRDQRPRPAGLRALAPLRPGDGPAGGRPGHAPPDDEP